jgi:hypothetical protein
LKPEYHAVPLGQKCLRKHFEFPQSFNDSHYVKFVHKLLLSFLEEEVLLIAFAAPVVANIADADASQHVNYDVPEGVTETSSIKEGEKE